jgi:signal transduction histidine kinase
MIFKKVHFPIFIAILCLLLACQKEKITTNKKGQNEYEKQFQTATNFNYKQQLDSAFYYYNAAKYLATNKDELVKALYFMATIQQQQCDFSGNEATATEALVKAIDTKYEPHIYNQLGISYLELYDYDNSIRYYKKALQKTTNELYKGILNNNIAVVYLEKKQYSTAIKILKPLVANDTLIKYQNQYARVLDNLGFAYFKTNNPNAENLLNQSLKIRETIKDDSESIASYIHLSQYYQQKNVSLAQQFAAKAYKAASKINSPDDKIEALQFMIASSNPEQAKQLALKQIALADSTNRVRQTAKNQFAKIKYDSQKDKKQVLIYKAQTENLTLGLSALVIISILSYFLIKAKNKKQQLQTSYNTEIRISKKLHDELANDVFHTLTFVETQDLSTTDNKETLLSSLDNIYSRTRNISKENSNINTSTLFVTQLKELMASFANNNVNIIINGLETPNWEKTSAEKKITTYRIIQELLVNMKKHSQCSIAVITFKKNKKNIQIEYTDNGVGATLEKINLKNGLQNVENRINAIKGTITFDTTTNKGFKVSFTFPT